MDIDVDMDVGLSRISPLNLDKEGEMKGDGKKGRVSILFVIPTPLKNFLFFSSVYGISIDMLFTLFSLYMSCRRV